MKEIVIEIAPSGEVKIEAVGFKGSSCDQATKVFEDALGVVADKKRKPEFYESTVKTVRQ